MLICPYGAKRKQSGLKIVRYQRVKTSEELKVCGTIKN